MVLCDGLMGFFDCAVLLGPGKPARLLTRLRIWLRLGFRADRDDVVLNLVANRVFDALREQPVRLLMRLELL